MKTEKWKKLMSLLISAAMTLTVMPAAVIAEDVPASEAVQTEAARTEVAAPRPGVPDFGPHSAREEKAHAYEPFKALEEKNELKSYPYVENTVVFKRNEGEASLMGENETDRLLAELGAEVEFVRSDGQGEASTMDVGGEPVTYKATIDGDVWEAVEKLEQMNDIIYAEPDYLFTADAVGLPDETTDSGFLEQWYITANDPGVKTAWDYLKEYGFSYGGRGDTVVAVIDTGVDYNHEDLAANMWVNTAELRGTPGVDDDGNGYVDDIYGASTVSNKYEHSGDPMDDHGHGTHVAGIIGMTPFNGRGGVGVAPGARIMAVKAGQANGQFSSTDIAEAIDYAVMMGADVINMSFGSYANSSIIADALKNAFDYCVLVAAAGNDGVPTYPALPSMMPANMYPAAYPYVLGVMAYDETGKKAGFSNWDYAKNDTQEYEIIAPGADIYSTLPGNRYARWDGTSMAAPMVAGAAALLRAKFSDKDSYSSRFIMGQLASATNRAVTYEDDYGMFHSFAMLNINDSLNNLPEPNLSYVEHYLFDTADIAGGNDADGIVDAGETVDLAVVLRNQWGKADEVVLTADAVSTGGMANPYVTFVTDSVEYGAIGTFDEDDNGLVKNEGGRITGVENPIRFTVDPKTPNDTVLPINIHVTAKNGYDPSDRAVYGFDAKIELLVQKGRVLKGEIKENLTMTKDDYWIIENSVLIPKGVTVNIEPGTQVQFWSSDPEGPYSDQAMPYIKVEGELKVNGTAEEPVEMFPSLAFEQYGVEIFSSTEISPFQYLAPIGNIEMNYVNVINPRFNAEKVSHMNAVQNYDFVYYRFLNDGKVDVYNYDGSIVAIRHLNRSKMTNLRCGDIYGCACVWGRMDSVLFDNCDIGFNRTDMTYGADSFYNSTFLINNAKVEDYSGINLKVSSFENSKLFDSFPSINGFENYGEYNGKHYITVRARGPFIDQTLENFAKSRGGHMADINSQEEWEFLSPRYDGDYLGLMRDEEGEFYWTSGAPVDYLPPMRIEEGRAQISYDDYDRDGNYEYGIGWYPYSDGHLLEFPDTVSEEEITAPVEITLGFIRGATGFDNNAILNRTLDPNVEHWMRITADGDNNGIYSAANNYWGTTDLELINKQIIDHDDYINMGDITETPILTDPPEEAYPFVADIKVMDSEGHELTEAGAQEITVEVSFNRDMDQSVQPMVSFGPAEPWTDFVVSGGWTDARTWRGTKKITSVTGDGMQYFRVIGARAADDHWLVTGNDWGRFAFEIITSGAEAMTLQATGGENKIDLQWIQDDYDTLAGYNLYRSETGEEDSFVRVNSSIIPAETKEYTDENVLMGKTYFYKFTVVTTDMKESGYSNTAFAAPLDSVGPKIDHTAIKTATPGSPIKFSARVTDDVKVVMVNLRYRKKGNESWKTIELKLSDNMDDYTAIMPASEVTRDIEYYIEASDGVSWSYHGLEEEPHIIKVYYVPELFVSGKAADKLPAAGATATVQVATNVENAKLIAAFYSGNKLVSVKTFTEKTYTVISGEITVPADADRLKLMVWNGAMPIIQAKEFSR